MTSPQPITIDELQGERSLNEWDIWLQPRLANLGSTREGVKYKRFQKGPMKVVKEEIIPTLHLIRRRFKDEEIFAAFPADNSAADAFIRPGSTTKATPLQITCNFGYDDQLRLELLDRVGMAPGAGPIARIGSRLEAENRAFTVEEAADELANSINDRLNSKARMFDTYDASTWLLVYIDDGRLLPEGLPRLLSKIQNAAAKSPFVATFLVGSTEQGLCELIIGTARWVS
jgi:hypothetical protein